MVWRTPPRRKRPDPLTQWLDFQWTIAPPLAPPPIDLETGEVLTGRARWLAAFETVRGEKMTFASFSEPREAGPMYQEDRQQGEPTEPARSSAEPPAGERPAPPPTPVTREAAPPRPVAQQAERPAPVHVCECGGQGTHLHARRGWLCDACYQDAAAADVARYRAQYAERLAALAQVTP